MKLQLKITAALLPASLIAMLYCASPVSAASTPPENAAATCKQVGKPTKESAGIPVCLQFFGSGGSLHFAADSDNRQFGTLSMDKFRADAPNPNWILNTRDGKKIDLGYVSDLLPNVPESYWFQTIVVVDRANKGFSVTPIIFVPKSTMVSGFAGKSFVGQTESFAAPKGVKSKNFIRIDMNKTVSGNSLMGTVVNFSKSIRENGSKVCQPKLLANKAATKWVQSSLGKNGVGQFEWFPAMHMESDSELSPSFIGGVSYMGGLPTLTKLLGKTLNTSAEFSFGLHGNPFVGVSNFTGKFVKSMPYETC